ncbi:hypothetical protein BS17DRAFT_852902 [Gyrodon lividus]|nr:hypothetical protein BS17DRAFT_852902 [Gyrodon lividus]
MSSTEYTHSQPNPDASNQEEHIQAAIIAINQSSTCRNGLAILSICQAVKDFDVPWATLQACFHGCKTCEHAHEHKQKLMPAQELVLVEWAMIAYVSDVAGISIGSSWVKRFKLCHPDLQVKWTQNLEQFAEYSILMENIYNMDEKGIQLGIGACIATFIDCNQATVYNIEHGNRKLVTSSTKGHIMTLSGHKITPVMPVYHTLQMAGQIKSWD